MLTGPGLLFNKDGPLAIQPGAGRAVLPWLMQFASACLPWHQERLQNALASVIVDADARWQDVIHRVDASDEWQRKGVSMCSLMRDLGVRQSVMRESGSAGGRL